MARAGGIRPSPTATPKRFAFGRHKKEALRSHRRATPRSIHQPEIKNRLSPKRFTVDCHKNKALHWFGRWTPAKEALPAADRF